MFNVSFFPPLKVLLTVRISFLFLAEVFSLLEYSGYNIISSKPVQLSGVKAWMAQSHCQLLEQWVLYSVIICLNLSPQPK